MDNDQITALAREYAEESLILSEDMPNCLRNEYLKLFADEVERLIRFLLRRYCLVEKSRLKKLDIAYRAKHYGTVVLNQGDIESLFPEIAKEV